VRTPSRTPYLRHEVRDPVSWWRCENGLKAAQEAAARAARGQPATSCSGVKCRSQAGGRGFEPLRPLHSNPPGELIFGRTFFYQPQSAKVVHAIVHDKNRCTDGCSRGRHRLAHFEHLKVTTTQHPTRPLGRDEAQLLNLEDDGNSTRTQCWVDNPELMGHFAKLALLSSQRSDGSAN